VNILCEINIDMIMHIKLGAVLRRSKIFGIHLEIMLLHGIFVIIILHDILVINYNYKYAMEKQNFRMHSSGNFDKDLLHFKWRGFSPFS
jgi:hypothetical protein